MKSLEDKGFREATVKSYVTLMAKVFSTSSKPRGKWRGKPLQMCFHLEEGTWSGTTFLLTKRSEESSARLPEKSGHTVPIEDIVKFAVFTGLESQRSFIQSGTTLILMKGSGGSDQPMCPTAEGLG